MNHKAHHGGHGHHAEHGRAPHHDGKDGGKYASHAHRAHRKSGGSVEHGEMAKDSSPREVYAGAGSNVIKEAEKKKRGGAAKHHGKHVEAHGHHSKHRLDRPARKHGGKVGAESRPYSAASSLKTPAGNTLDPEYD